MDSKRIYSLIEDAYDSVKSIGKILSADYDIDDQGIRRNAVRAKLRLKKVLSILDAEKSTAAPIANDGQNVVDYIE